MIPVHSEQLLKWIDHSTLDGTLLRRSVSLVSNLLDLLTMFSNRRFLIVFQRISDLKTLLLLFIKLQSIECLFKETYLIHV